MENEVKTNKPGKKKIVTVLAIIAGVLLLAGLLILLFWPNLKVTFLMQKLKNANVGDSFTLGTYEQDGKTDNGTENIKWLVLAKEDDRVLAISK